MKSSKIVIYACLIPVLIMVIMIAIVLADAGSGTFNPGESSDDVLKVMGASWTTNAVTLRAWGKNISSAGHYSGFRFLSATIPDTAIIDSAFFNFYGGSVSNPGATCLFRIYGQDTGDAATFSDSNDYNARRVTTAYVFDSGMNVGTNTLYRLNDIKTVIQEIVNRADWASGNDLAILIQDSGLSAANKYNTIFTYDSTTTDPAAGAKDPFLTVYWTTPAPAFTAGLVHKGPSTGQAAIRYQGTSMNYVHKKYHIDIKED